MRLKSLTTTKPKHNSLLQPDDLLDDRELGRRKMTSSLTPGLSINLLPL